MSAQSSAPFNIVLGQDLNGDAQYNDRPTFATDLTRPSVVTTKYGVFDTAPIAGQTDDSLQLRQWAQPGVRVPGDWDTRSALGRRSSRRQGRACAEAGSRGPSLRSRIRCTRWTFPSMRRICSTTGNLAQPVGTLTSPLFGQSQALAFGNQSGNREVDLQMYFHF